MPVETSQPDRRASVGGRTTCVLCKLCTERALCGLSLVLCYAMPSAHVLIMKKDTDSATARETVNTWKKRSEMRTFMARTSNISATNAETSAPTYDWSPATRGERRLATMHSWKNGTHRLIRPQAQAASIHWLATECKLKPASSREECRHTTATHHQHLHLQDYTRTIIPIGVTGAHPQDHRETQSQCQRFL